jgi:hypothetical protein
MMTVQVEQDEGCARLTKNAKDMLCDITAHSDCNKTYSRRLTIVSVSVELQLVSALKDGNISNRKKT